MTTTPATIEAIEAAPVVPEIWYKAKRVIRTVLAVLVAIVVSVGAGLGTFAIVAPQVLEQLRELLPPEVYAWLAGVIAFTILLSGAITRIMAIPQVNAFLAKFGAGSVPKAVVEYNEAKKADTLAVLTSPQLEVDPTPSDEPPRHVA